MLYALLNQGTAGVTLSELAPLIEDPRLGVWTIERLMGVISAEAGLVAHQWVAVQPESMVVSLEAWAVEWLGWRPSRDGLTWRVNPRPPDEIPLNFDPVDPEIARVERAAWAGDELRRRSGRPEMDTWETIVLMGGGYAFRERHKASCHCRYCAAKEPTATRPVPPGRCRACGGRRLRANHECIECGRGGRDARLAVVGLPASETAKAAPAAPAKAPLTRKERRRQKYAKTTGQREGAA